MTDHPMPAPSPHSGISLGTLRAETHADLVEQAREIAAILADVIQRQGLFVSLGGRRYVRCEGWTTLAVLLGCTPTELAVEERDDGRYIAVVELRRLSDGQPLSRASAECGGPGEPLWQQRPPYARRSMAITRATSKACRLAMSWIVALAGYEPTPAEEVEGLVASGVPLIEDRDPSPPSPSVPPATPSPPAGGRRITEAQQRRLFAMAKRAGLDREAVRALIARYGYASTADVSIDHYEAICAHLEAQQPNPELL